MNFNNELKAFHGNQILKDIYREKLVRHVSTESGIEHSSGCRLGRGCGIACAISDTDFTAYEQELGIPAVLGAVESRIFEGLSGDAKKVWSDTFLSAIRPDADLSGIWPDFVSLVLEDLVSCSRRKLQRDGIQLVSRLYRERCTDLNEWSKASLTSYRGGTTATKDLIKSWEPAVIAGITASFCANNAAHFALAMLLHSPAAGDGISTVTLRHALKNAEMFVAKAAEAQSVRSSKPEAEAAKAAAYVHQADKLLELLLQA